jgi:hypothetical protein
MFDQYFAGRSEIKGSTFKIVQALSLKLEFGSRPFSLGASILAEKLSMIRVDKGKESYIVRCTTFFATNNNRVMSFRK